MNLDTIAMLFQLQAAIGEALPREDQLFVSENYHKLMGFAHSDTGKLAIQTFVSDWRDSTKIRIAK